MDVESTEKRHGHHHRRRHDKHRKKKPAVQRSRSSASSSVSGEEHQQDTQAKKKKRHHKTTSTVTIKQEAEEEESEDDDDEDDLGPREHPITHLKRIKLLNGKDKDSIKSVKLREPNDIQHEKTRSLKKRTAEEAFNAKKPASAPLGPLVVMPRRENQNEYVLSPFIRRQGEFPLQRDIEATTVTALTQQQQQQKNEFPIEDLLSSGFMPFYHNNIPGVLGTVSAEFYRNAMLIEHENTVNTTNSSNNNNGEDEAPIEAEEHQHKRQKTTAADAATAAAGVTPLNQSIMVSQLSWDVANYGPNNTTGKAELYEKVHKFYANFKQRMKHFYIDDQLTRETHEERQAALTHGRHVKHRPPRSFAIYRDLEEKMGARYHERLNIMQESASRVPKFRDEPPVPKHWFEEYRLRPLASDQLCSKGSACRFNTFIKKDSARYIGRRFQSPAEVRDGYVRNTEGLCIDCLLYSWTKRAYKNVGGEKAQLVQINYFTVACEPGQYNRECLLPQELNGRPTGIVGCVPTYNTGKRISVPIKLQRIDGDCLVDIATNYTAETGTDF